MGTPSSSIIRTGCHPQPRGSNPVLVDPVLERSSDQSRGRTVLREACWRDHHAIKASDVPLLSHPKGERPRRLRQKDPTAAQQSGQFELRTNTETYLRDGRFDQDRILEVFEQLASGNAKDRRQRQ